MHESMTKCREANMKFLRRCEDAAKELGIDHYAVGAWTSNTDDDVDAIPRASAYGFSNSYDREPVILIGEMLGYYRGIMVKRALDDARYDANGRIIDALGVGETVVGRDDRDDTTDVLIGSNDTENDNA
jgi:hypothetical protein